MNNPEAERARRMRGAGRVWLVMACVGLVVTVIAMILKTRNDPCGGWSLAKHSCTLLTTSPAKGLMSSYTTWANISAIALVLTILAAVTATVLLRSGRRRTTTG